MSLESKVITCIAAITGIPEEDISQEKFLEKDLGVSELELKDILSDLSRELGFPLSSEGKDLKTVQDLILIVHENQPLA